MLSRVDLPQPEWPMMETYSPCSILTIDVGQHLALELPRTNDLVTWSMCRNDGLESTLGVV